jgi:hypothetical protein
MASGAQTERRGKAWAGECIASRRELTGRVVKLQIEDLRFQI